LIPEMKNRSSAATLTRSETKIHQFTNAVDFPSPYLLRQASPPSWLPMFKRVALARNLAQLRSALCVLVPQLLRRGQPPEHVAHDLELLVNRCCSYSYLADAVMPIVAELALQRVST
jgi:hypothetical protein